MNENNNENIDIGKDVQNENTVNTPDTNVHSDNDAQKNEVNVTDNEENAEKNPLDAAAVDGASGAPVSENTDDDSETRWNYPDRDEDVKIEIPKKKKANGGFIFAIVAVVVFIVALTVLLASMLIGGVESSSGINRNQDYVSENDFATSATLEKVKYSTVLVSVKTTTGNSVGTGIIMDENGNIATNYHVIQNSTKIVVTLYNQKSYDAEVVGYSERDDLAVIKINATGLSPATFGSSSTLKLCQNVYAIGCPGGADFAWTVTRGSISCPDREIKVYNSNGILEKKMKVIQTDTALNHGNSGGPLIDANGSVIGIVSMRLGSNNGVNYEGMGFAIPIDGALELLESIINTGSTENVTSSVSSSRPLIGITGKAIEGGKWYTNESVLSSDTNVSVSEAEAKTDESMHFYASQSGVVVVGLTEGLDAKGKLEIFDIITEVDGYTVENIYDVMSIINTKNAGDSVTLTVYRGTESFEVSVILGSGE